MSDRVAILLDGGFVKKKLQQQCQRFPEPQDVVGLCGRLMEHPRLAGRELLRIYFYDAPPFEGRGRNPVDGQEVDFSATPAARRNRALLDSLQFEDDFAVRKGSLIFAGWKLGRRALGELASAPRPIGGGDLVPNIQQKGVDIKIGLDIAWIAGRRLVEVLVLVTGDSDFVPAMKFARREGLRVYLAALGHGVRPELKVHADLVLE